MVDIVSDKTKRYLIRGPLVLDGLSEGAMLDGEKLPLNERQFNALYLLAQRESERLTFEQLYEAQWNPYNGNDNRGQARAELGDMVAMFNTAGKAEVWIEDEHGQVFEFRLK